MVNFQLRWKKLPDLRLDKERCLCDTPVNPASQIFAWCLLFFNSVYLLVTIFLGYRASYSRAARVEPIYIIGHSTSALIAIILLIGTVRKQPKLFLPFILIHALFFVILVIHTVLAIIVSMVSALFHVVSEKRAIDEYNITVHLNVYDNVFYFSNYPIFSTIIYLAIETIMVTLQGYMTSVVYRAYKLLEASREEPNHYVNPCVSSLNPDEVNNEELKV